MKTRIKKEHKLLSKESLIMHKHIISSLANKYVKWLYNMIIYLIVMIRWWVVRILDVMKLYIIAIRHRTSDKQCVTGALMW